MKEMKIMILWNKSTKMYKGTEFSLSFIYLSEKIATQQKMYVQQKFSRKF